MLSYRAKKPNVRRPRLRNVLSLSARIGVWKVAVKDIHANARYELGQELVTSPGTSLPPSPFPFRIFVPTRQPATAFPIGFRFRIESSRGESWLYLSSFFPKPPVSPLPDFGRRSIRPRLSEISLEFCFPPTWLRNAERERESE